MKEIAANIKYATYLDKFDVISFIEKCLFENNQPFNEKNIDSDLNNFDKTYCEDNMLIFRINGKIAGTAAYKVIIQCRRETIKIVRIYLDSKYKGFGYGKILMQTLLSLIRTKHYKINTAYLTTHTETMKVAYNMYKYFGFEDSNDFRINKQRCNILMKLKL